MTSESLRSGSDGAIRRRRPDNLLKSARRAMTVFLYFIREEPLRGCLMLFSMIVAGMLEGIGIAALLPLLNIIVGGPESEASIITRTVKESLSAMGLEPTVGALLALVVIAITAKAIILVFAAKQIGYTAAAVTMNLRLRLLEDLMRARWSFFVRQRLGSISAAMTSEPARAASTYVQVARALTGMLQLVVYTALALTISIEVSIAALLVGIASSMLLHRFVVITGKTGQRQTLLTKSLLSALTDGLQSMKPLKAMAREKQLSAILQKDIAAMNNAQRLQILARESLANYREPITTLALAIGLYTVLSQWDLDLESLLVMAFLFLRTIARIASMQTNFQSIASTLPAFWFVRSVLSTAAKAAEKEAHGKDPIFETAIRLDGVDFAYQKNRPILKSVSLTLPKGRFTAVFGSSGSGKTTIADLVTGLLRPSGGSVLVDQMPLSEIDQTAWRHLIGYVPQETPLLHDTILNNITLRDPKITESMVSEALQLAGAWSFVQEMPEGLNTVVGERGTRLSGGQRQRIAIARAMAHKPALLILDEATAALDPQTEAEICETLKNLAGRATILAISHQDALQDAADFLYRVENGSVEMQRGSGAEKQQISAP